MLQNQESRDLNNNYKKIENNEIKDEKDKHIINKMIAAVKLQRYRNY